VCVLPRHEDVHMLCGYQHKPVLCLRQGVSHQWQGYPSDVAYTWHGRSLRWCEFCVQLLLLLMVCCRMRHAYIHIGPTSDPMSQPWLCNVCAACSWLPDSLFKQQNQSRSSGSVKGANQLTGHKPEPAYTSQLHTNKHCVLGL